MISLCLPAFVVFFGIIKLDHILQKRSSYVQLFIRIKFDQIFEIKI